MAQSNRLPPYIKLLIDKGALSTEQVEEAAEQAQQKNVSGERMLILLGYLTKTQLIDAIDQLLSKDTCVEDTESGVMELRQEIQTLTGVARIAKMNAKPR